MLDWRQLLAPGNILDHVVRGTAIFVVLFLLLRFLPNRKTGAIGPSDLLVVVLLAQGVSRALTADAESLTSALVLVLTVIAWSFMLDVLAARVPGLRWLVHSEPVPVVRDGKVIERNLRREFMTKDELLTQLRLQGVDDVGDVKRAYVEHDGRLSVISDGSRPRGARRAAERT